MLSHFPFRLSRTVAAAAAFLLLVHAAPAQDALPRGALVRLGSVRFLHESRPSAIAFLPGNKSILAASGDVVREWDRTTGKVIRRFAGDASSHVSAAPSPDGRLLAVGDTGANLRVWDVASGKPCGTVQCGHPIFCIAWSADGKTLAVGHGKAIGLYGRDLKLQRQLTGLTANVRCLVFGRNLLVSSSNDKSRAVWDPVEGKKLHDLEGPADWDGVTAVSPDGKLAAGDYARFTSDKSHWSLLAVWEIATGKRLHELPGHGTLAVAFAPDGVLVSGDNDGKLRFWDVVKGKELRQWRAHEGRVRAIAFTGDGKTLASAASDQRLRFWDAGSGREIDPPFGHTGPAQALAWSPDGRTLVSGGKDNTIRFWDWLAGRELRRCENIGTHWGVRQLAYAADGKTLVSMDQTTWTAIFRRWSADGKELLQFGEKAQHVSRFRLMPDGETLAGACWDGAIRIWQLDTGKVLRKIGMHKGHLLDLALSPDRRTFAWAGEYQGMGLWDAVSGEEVRRFEGIGHHVDATLAFSPDGTLLAAGSASDPARVWPLDTTAADKAAGTGAFELPTPHHVADLAFSPDGATLAVASGPELILWDILARKTVATFRHARSELKAIAWAPHGRAIATAASDGTLLVWDATDGLLEGGELRRVELTVKEAASLWQALGDVDAMRARRAAWKLAACPQTPAWLADWLRPIGNVDSKKLDTLAMQLDDDDFAVRQRATQTLAGLGQAARDTLRGLAESSRSAESRARAWDLLRRLGSETLAAERRRCQRAVTLLEWSSAPPARDLLATLAKGAPDAHLTRVAQAALARVNAR
jgi:WD40 repeat protein